MNYTSLFGFRNSKPHEIGMGQPHKRIEMGDAGAVQPIDTSEIQIAVDQIIDCADELGVFPHEVRRHTEEHGGSPIAERDTERHERVHKPLGNLAIGPTLTGPFADPRWPGATHDPVHNPLIYLHDHLLSKKSIPQETVNVNTGSEAGGSQSSAGDQPRATYEPQPAARRAASFLLVPNSAFSLARDISRK